MQAAANSMVRRLLVGTAIGFALFRLAPGDAAAQAWLQRIPLDDGRATIVLGDPPVVWFLEFGGHRFAPDEVRGPDGVDAADAIGRGAAVVVAPFQELTARPWRFPASWGGKRITIVKQPRRDAFWDQVLAVDMAAIEPAPRWKMAEAGEFGQSLPPQVREIDYSADAIRAMQASLVDPVIPERVERDISWRTLEAAAYPLDFQKVLLASRNDASPAFAYQNGQWFTTWLSHDLPKWNKEDHWFAPALLVGDRLVRPAPLAAETEFVTTDDGVTLPMWRLRWRHEGATITQRLFSHRADGDTPPRLYVRFQVENLPAGARLALGVGRRPNCHYWDDTSRERTPVPFFTLPTKYRQAGQSIVDGDGKVILQSASEFLLQPVGPVEMLATFAADEHGDVYLCMPQTEVAELGVPFANADYEAAHRAAEESWSRELRKGAQVRLPSAEWMRRIDIWQSQVAAITRVHYQGAERLSYGANFYQAYFGPEEGWPVVALAQWGRGDEARRQAEILLSAESRDKSNVHHQSRNGTAAWYAAEVARLTHDAAWLEKIAPALVENAEWTIAARESTQGNPSPLTRGLLPAHIYGGDIRDPATSFYASLVCYKGLVETADVFRQLGTPERQRQAERFQGEAEKFRRRLAEVMHAVIDRSTTPPFLPLALDIPSLDGRNEGPYERLTETRLGNYWNLFAPSVLELGLTLDDEGRPNDVLLDYMASHGGLWASLPRFNHGLDAAYSIGVLRELQRQSMRDAAQRPRALAGLEAFFLHAASRNGYAIPEVAGLFPDRLERAAYERLVRESPWSFGMYDAERYLGGHISFTEPLGAAAGEALWLIREALVSEGRDDNGLANGELILFSTVPSEWFAEGKEIALENFPTGYGTISVRSRSMIESRGRVDAEYRFEKWPGVECDRVRIRVAAPGHSPVEKSIAGESGEGTLEFDFRQ